MDDQKRRDAGTAKRRKVLGNAWVDKSSANTNSFNAEFIDLITRYAWSEIWNRPHFEERTRRVLVIGTMVALGQWDEFRMHVRAALTEGGFTPDDIKEILLQQDFLDIVWREAAFRQRRAHMHAEFIPLTERDHGADHQHPAGTLLEMRPVPDFAPGVARDQVDEFGIERIGVGG